MNVLILVLGQYTDVSKYVEDIPLPHEEVLMVKRGDLYNIHYRDGKGKDKVNVEGSEFDLEGVPKLNKEDDKDASTIFNLLLDKNSCRTKSNEDVIGLYSNDTTLIRYLPEGLDGLSVDIYYNYLVKSQQYSTEPYLLFIVDNTDVTANTYNNIEYIISKERCETVVFTTSDPSQFNNLIRNYGEEEINVTVQQI